MKKWFIYAIGLGVGAIIFSHNQDVAGVIAGASTLVLSVAIAVLLENLRNTKALAAFVASFVGFIVVLAVFALARPLFMGLPYYVLYGLMGLALTAGTYGFYLYQVNIGFNSGPGTGAASGPISAVDSDAAPLPIRGGIPKVLDTSIVIDGRIIDLASTGFVEGPFIIPNFVLRELQLISDSADAIKRSRGRRGLDMLNDLQKRKDLEVTISYKDYTDTREVDAKLIKISKELNAKLVTNDFNLNKVAELQGLTVLNINNLANALKPVVLPGEEMEIQVVKEGKDDNQGIGYLDDGTMVVIESGGRLVGKKARVSVTSVIQTNAGKMIFTKAAGKSKGD